MTDQSPSNLTDQPAEGVPGSDAAALNIAPSTSKPLPRIWPSIVVGCVAPVFAIIASGIIVAIMMLIDVGVGKMQDSDDVQTWVYEFGSTPIGLAVLVLPADFVFVAAIAAALLSREGFAERLAIRPAAFPLLLYPILMLATLAVGMIGSLLTWLLPDVQSDQLAMIYTAMASATGAEVVLMVIVISLVPSVVEETLFRGYVQSRLLRRWPPVLAIGFSTFVFALAHFDPIHSLAVLPIGAWLGVIAWRAGSILPAMICHMFNNAVGFVTAGLATDSTIDTTMELPIWMLAVAVSSLIVSIFILARRHSA